MPEIDLQTLRRRFEPGRLLLGSALETLIKAYGAGAALLLVAALGVATIAATA